MLAHGAERLLEAQRVGVRAGGDLEGGLQGLGGAVLLAEVAGDAEELEQHLGRARQVVGGGGLTAHDEQQRAEGTLRPVELAGLAGELAQQPEHPRVAHVDARREVELGERLREVSPGAGDERELVVGVGALRRALPPVGLEQRVEDGPRLVEPTGGAQGVGERDAQPAVVGRSRRGGLEHRHSALRRVEALVKDLRGLAQLRRRGSVPVRGLRRAARPGAPSGPTRGRAPRGGTAARPRRRRSRAGPRAPSAPAPGRRSPRRPGRAPPPRGVARRRSRGPAGARGRSPRSSARCARGAAGRARRGPPGRRRAPRCGRSRRWPRRRRGGRARPPSRRTSRARRPRGPRRRRGPRPAPRGCRAAPWRASRRAAR